MDTRRAKERATLARAREVGLGRRRRFFYVSGLCARPEPSREWVERQRSVKLERVDGYEGLLAGIDSNERGEALKKVRMGEMTREGKRGHPGEPVCDGLDSELFFRM